MKKYFTKAVTLMMLATSSFTLTSCDLSGLADIPWTDLVGNLLGELLGGKTGTTYNYQLISGEANLLKLQPGGGYVYDETAEVSLKGMTLSVTDCGNSANLGTPNLTVDGATVSAVTISGMTMTPVTLDNGTNVINIDLPDNCSGEGKITLDGVEYELSGPYIENGYVSANDVQVELLQFYFGPNGEYVLSLSNVQGLVLTENK